MGRWERLRAADQPSEAEEVAKIKLGLAIGLPIALSLWAIIIAAIYLI